MNKDNIKHWPGKGSEKASESGHEAAADKQEAAAGKKELTADKKELTADNLEPTADNQETHVDSQQAHIDSQQASANNQEAYADNKRPGPSKRSIYLLPNLFTTGALFGGFYAILMSLQSNFEAAAIAIFAAAFFDGLDGRVARLTNTQSEFGVEYDSLSDMVSFGVAPAVLMYTWMLEPLGKFGWSAAFIYTACAALRLARFNVKSSGDDKRYFMGLASPPAAAIIWTFAWAGHEMEPSTGLSIFFALLTIATGLLMVSGFKYHSFKEINLTNKVPFTVVFAIVMMLAIIMIDPPRVLLCMALVYALYAPVLRLIQYLRKI